MNWARPALLVSLCIAAVGVDAFAADARTPKGYAIAEISVTDAEAYKPYVAAVSPMVEKFGGKYLIRGGDAVAVEGEAPAGRLVVLEFPSLDAARAFYDSDEYQAILPLRLKSAASRVFFIEGYAP